MKDENGKDVDLKTGDIIQNSVVVPGRWWRVVQTKDTVTAGTRDYSEQSRYAKTIQKDNKTWGSVPKDDKPLAHSDDSMTCFACHSSWMTSCFGCHLSMEANRKMPNRHNEGGDSRNFTQYNFQVLRDDIFMLGRDGTVTGNKIAPVVRLPRWSCPAIESRADLPHNSKPFRQKASQEPSTRMSLIPCAARKRSNALTATFPKRTTTMPGWPSYFYREPTLSISWGAMSTLPVTMR
jgi:hypothetical protein